jgi:pimeloyl-ACP methyl ester carboxylesterase
MAISAELGERRTVTVPAGTLEYRERGSGPAIVFAHGAGVNGDVWRKVVPALATDHRCLAVDLPLGGHSLPLRGDQDLSLYGCAEILASFLEALDLQDVVLVANDTGGAIAQALVGSRPDRVGRLVLTSCDAFGNYPPRPVAYLKTVTRSAVALWLLAQAMRLRVAQRLPIAYGWATHRRIERRIMGSYLHGLRSSPGVRRDFSHLLRRADPADTIVAADGLRTFHRPALVAWAADDRFFPREHGERLAELLPQGRFVLIERSRTFIPEDNPTALVDAVREFLGSSTKPGSADDPWMPGGREASQGSSAGRP